MSNEKQGKYTLTLITDPASLETGELAVLMAATTHLSSFEKIPGFDPTRTVMELTFASRPDASAAPN